MIPFWIKLLWNIYGFVIMFYSMIPFSGIVVSELAKQSGQKFSKETEKELKKSIFFLVYMVAIWIVIFIGTMIYYKIPFNEWIG